MKQEPPQKRHSRAGIPVLQDGKDVNVELSHRAAGLFTDVKVPVLGRCPDCGSARQLATPHGLMPSHVADGEHCLGSIKRPERVLAGTELVEAILEQEANERGEYCARGHTDRRHDSTRCPGFHT